MKFIDAERLRKEVKMAEEVAHKSALGCADSEERKFHKGRDFAYQYVGFLIDSLQQEQPVVKDPFDDEQFRRGYEAGKHDAMREQKPAERSDALEIDTIRDWSMRFAPDIREEIVATAYHFYNLALNDLYRH